MEKYIYSFEEGGKEMKNLLGGKGANLAEMTKIGLPVPPGFTITTEVCAYFTKNGKYPDGLWEGVLEHMKELEEKVGKKFGDEENPLLVSVRSGAPISMPGMMDTILNLGLNDLTVKGLEKQTGDERFAYDSYRRLIQMFGNVVMGVPHEKFEEIITEQKKKRGVKEDTELTADDWRDVIKKYKELIKKETGKEFPQDPYEQLRMAVDAVFKSWNNPRAIVYRKANKIPDDLGTAVNIQAMVFGNMGPDSGTGVAFTRNPATGEKEYFGEFLFNAQGEDVVAGIRTPKSINDLKKEIPEVYNQLVNVFRTLEEHYKDMQDLEFTVEKGKLYLLQTRTGKRTAAAAVKIAVDMVNEGLISKEEAIMRVKPEDLNQLLHRRLDPTAKKEILAKGLGASPGAASGKVVFDADEAVKLSEKGEKVILVRNETTPEDIHGMIASQGILTVHGGMTSHAAVVARGMGKPCVVGCEDIEIHDDHLSVGDVKIFKGEEITIDGATGEVMKGIVPTVEPTLSEEFKTLLKWADEIRDLGVRANADTPKDAAKAVELGAEGIGLCRTEHMFFAPDRLPTVQRMIMAKTTEERKKYLDLLLPMQREDFIGIFKAMGPRPVIIRLIDPPLHEFLPKREDLLVDLTLAKERGDENVKELEELLERVNELHEANPMLGLRGCRLGILYPEIIEMQTRAIMEAAVAVKNEGIDVRPEIMIPLVGHVNELKIAREIVDRVAKKVLEENDADIHYMIGTMIEVPRAALTSEEIAKYADFYSFGTNDLTQMTFGYSRDDAEAKFLGQYLDKKILKENPFAVLDRDGVGKLMKMAVKNGRKSNPKLEVGICGEHGGNPSSIEFCHLIGLDYVSCSPFRIPIARLAAAQAKLKNIKQP